MKNLKLAFSIIVMALIAFACEDEKTNPVVENGSATISGIAYADLDEMNNLFSLDEENMETAPEGTVLYATFSSEELVLVPNNNATYADIIVETTVGADGAYTFTVPANSNTFSVSITSDDFVSEFVDVDVIADTVITYDKIYTLSEVSVGGIHTGVSRKQNLYFE